MNTNRLTLDECEYLSDEQSNAKIVTLLANLPADTTVGEVRKELRAMIEVEKNKTHCQNVSMGVGDGSGNLYVHGSYESICRVRNAFKELDELKGKPWSQ